MAELPALMIWVDAYESATSHLTFEEHGLYLKLLFLMWRTPGCRVPDDDTWIARRLRFAVDQVPILVRPLIVEFCQVSGGFIYQKRLMEEFKTASNRRDVKRAAAKSRWDKEKDTCNSTPSADAKPAAVQMQNAASAHAPISISIPMNHHPSSSSKTTARARDETNFAKICNLLGHNANDPKNWGEFIDLQTRVGLDFERHIWSAAQHHQQIGKPGHSLAYIRKKAMEMREQEAATADAPVVFEDTSDEGWYQRVKYATESADKPDSLPWLPKWGPRIGEPGCKVPAKVLAQFKVQA